MMECKEFGSSLSEDDLTRLAVMTFNRRYMINQLKQVTTCLCTGCGTIISYDDGDLTALRHDNQRGIRRPCASQIARKALRCVGFLDHRNRRAIALHRDFDFDSYHDMYWIHGSLGYALYLKSAEGQIENCNQQILELDLEVADKYLRFVYLLVLLQHYCLRDAEEDGEAKLLTVDDLSIIEQLAKTINDDEFHEWKRNWWRYLEF
eukprot:TRINITY_DN21714_c0_g1_i8.p1 TRINITY_DN21714_c0_g1~~TRINITY_DN21714_c0_g1_i8.p1  ORF type:complete len:206 (+),score=42.02 TRINITY_DN21714_c0_g1_i8:66-683(+)